MKSGVSSRTSAAVTPGENAGQDDVSRGDSAGPELVDATVYDLERLERVVLALTQEHRALRRDNREKQRTLEGREAQIRELESKLEQSLDLREQVVRRLDAVIGELEKLEDRFVQDAKNARG